MAPAAVSTRSTQPATDPAADDKHRPAPHPANVKRTVRGMPVGAATRSTPPTTTAATSSPTDTTATTTTTTTTTSASSPSAPAPVSSNAWGLTSPAALAALRGKQNKLKRLKASKAKQRLSSTQRLERMQQLQQNRREAPHVAHYGERDEGEFSEVEWSESRVEERGRLRPLSADSNYSNSVASRFPRLPHSPASHSEQRTHQQCDRFDAISDTLQTPALSPSVARLVSVLYSGGHSNSAATSTAPVPVGPRVEAGSTKGRKSMVPPAWLSVRVG